MRPKPAQAPGYIDEPIAIVRSWGASSDTLWYLQGNNYNVEALTNRTGAIVERYAYTPYGEPTVYTAAGTDGKWFTADDVTASVSAKGNALTFQGRELDAETGVYYFRNRYYSAQMGRFVSRDPLRLDGGDLNIYRIVGNSTFSNLDPEGLKTHNVQVCIELLVDIVKKVGLISAEFAKFDPLSDALGSFTRWDWVLKKKVPGAKDGHRTEILRLQEKLRTNMREFMSRCMDDDDCDGPPRLPKELLETAYKWATRRVPTVTLFLPIIISNLTTPPEADFGSLPMPNPMAPPVAGPIFIPPPIIIIP